jgi:hypothetical protein
VLAQVEDLTAEGDGALLAVLDLDSSPPAGGASRLDGPVGGGRRIVGQWDRDGDGERFRDDRLMPVPSGPGPSAAGDREAPATEAVRILPVRPVPH